MTRTDIVDLSPSMIEGRRKRHVTRIRTVRIPEQPWPPQAVSILLGMPRRNTYVNRLMIQNVDEDYSIHDAPLTALGKQQASRLPSLTPELQSVAQVIVSSPLRRTLQTVSLGYKDAVQRLGGLGEVVCLPELQGTLRAHQNATMCHVTPAPIGRCSKGCPSLRASI